MVVNWDTIKVPFPKKFCSGIDKKIFCSLNIPSLIIHQARLKRLHVSELPGKFTCPRAAPSLSAPTTTSMWPLLATGLDVSVTARCQLTTNDHMKCCHQLCLPLGCCIQSSKQIWLLLIKLQIWKYTKFNVWRPSLHTDQNFISCCKVFS